MRSILYYVESWGMGGIEAFLMSTIRSLDSGKYTFDIFTVHDRDVCFDKEIESLGGRRFCVFPGRKPNQLVRLLVGLREFRRLLSDGNYEIVHINTMNGMGFAYAWVAKKVGIPIRIVHSHNSDVGRSFRYLKRFISLLGRVVFSSSATSRVACSAAAGDFLFGKNPFDIIRNGIELDRFSFNLMKRKQLRDELGVSPNQTLIGNISRLSAAKNPVFQLKIFKEYLKLDPSAKYLLADRGEMLAEVDNWIEKLGLGDNVIRFAPRQECEGFYSAMDALCFPSLFEGLPLILVEAQCAGLPVYISDCVSQEVLITPHCKVLSLSQSAAEWASCIFQNMGKRPSNDECVKALERGGYNIDSSVLALARIYERPLARKNI